MANQTVILLDVGPSMCEAARDGSPRKVDLAVKAIMLFLQRLLDSAIDKKSFKDEVALVLVGTEATSNPLATDSPGYYKNISLHQDLDIPTANLLRFLANSVTPGGVAADAVDMVCIGLDCIVRGSAGKKKLKSKTLLIFSDLSMPCNIDDQYSEIAEGLKAEEIVVKVCGPEGPEEDWCDGDVVNPIVAPEGSAEATLRSFCKDTGGVIRSLQESIRLLEMFKETETLMRPTFQGPLEIGPLAIRVASYLRQKRQAPTKFKKFSNHVLDEDPTDSTIGIVNVQSEYVTEDGDTIDKKAVKNPEEDTPEIVKGYKFGKSVVPVTDAALAETKLAEERSLKFIAFVPEAKLHQYDFVGAKIESIQPVDGDQSATALSALCNAMKERRVFMVVRMVSMKGRDPKLLALWPHIKPFASSPYSCLLGAPIPYSDDYQDLDLPDFTTISGYGPDEEQSAAMDAFVHSLDLMTAEKDEDGEAMEALQPKFCFNPSTQRVLQGIHDRALKGTLDTSSEELPKMEPKLSKAINPHLDLWPESTAEARSIGERFPLEEVASKKKGKARTSAAAGATDDAASKRSRPQVEEQSISSILRGAAKKVGEDDPIGDYKSMVESTEEDKFDLATSQLQNLIRAWLDRPSDDALIQRIQDSVGIMREKCGEACEEDNFNTFVRSLKDIMGKNSAKHEPLWMALRNAKLSLLPCDGTGDGVLPFEDDIPVVVAAAPAAKVAMDEDDLDEL